ncbi:MAG TPA: glycosyltransferase [Gemmatimonas sp.]|uniref:glycosyltransferase n=1 Tax=Gemmatimonas sp. TaxID=1962908 RepID=UPI002ED8DFDD
MRVLVLTTALRFTPDVQLLLHLAAALHARGEVVAVAGIHRSAVDRAVTTGWPRLSVRTFGSVESSRHTSAVREVVSALRPDVVLVRSEADARLASAAMGARGGVLRLLGLDEREASDDAGGSRWSFGRTRARIVEWGRRSPALSWPSAAPDDEVHETGLTSELLVLPAPPHAETEESAPYDGHTATALRAAAHLRRRHSDLKVTLLGEPEGMQSARVHAAALDLTSALSIRSVQSLLGLHERGATALWVADQGDGGAICTMAAMSQGIPVVMAHDAAASVLVAPAITGFFDQVASAGGTVTSVSLVMELARLLGDRTVRRTMGEAARHKAQREHGWEAFVDEATAQLVKAGGAPSRDRTSKTTSSAGSRS